MDFFGHRQNTNRDTVSTRSLNIINEWSAFDGTSIVPTGELVSSIDALLRDDSLKKQLAFLDRGEIALCTIASSYCQRTLSIGKVWVPESHCTAVNPFTWRQVALYERDPEGGKVIEGSIISPGGLVSGASLTALGYLAGETLVYSGPVIAPPGASLSVMQNPSPKRGSIEDTSFLDYALRNSYAAELSDQAMRLSISM